MPTHLDIFQSQFNKQGEELCGDTVRVRRTEARTIVVLSDGLGSGVKANILATLTAEIIVNMLAADAPMEEVVRTVLGTLPVCKVRQLAYATFTVVAIENATGHFQVMNFDNPRVIWLRRRKLQVPERQTRKILDREVATLQGTLEDDDFLGLLSDGTLHAGLGLTMNLGWGWDNVARFVEELATRWEGDARGIVRRVMGKVADLYEGRVGDDATFVGISARPLRSAVVFTGPPVSREDDSRMARRVLEFAGRRIICGGTTGNIVARYLDEEPDVVIETMRPDVPPIAKLREIDLLTEGIITMSKAMDLLRGALADRPIEPDGSGSHLLAAELLRADDLHFIVGQTVNDYYQNPTLPAGISLRRGLVKDLIDVLKAAGKEVTVEYC